MDNTKKIQPVISERAYSALIRLKQEERSTITSIVERAIKEYAERHCPDALK